jgi:hypothetical protein
MSTFNAERRAEFLTHMRNGMQRGAAAEAMELTRKEVIDYIGAHEDYEALVLDAEARATEHVQEALFQAAVSGHVHAAKLWLELTGKMRPKLPTTPLTGDPCTNVQDDADDELAELMRVAKKERD